MKIRGFKIKKHLRRLSRWILRRPKSDAACHRLYVSDRSAPYDCKSKPFSKLLTWSRRITSTTRSLCSAMRPGSGYVPVGQDPQRERSVSVPKGHLAVYVGQKDGDYRRVLVPVIYFNHPLFGDLLKEAEEEYGFNQQGGITIPCGVSEFERVKTRIAAGCGGRRMTWRRQR